MKKQTEAFTGSYFFIRHQRWNVKVRLSDITYIESQKNYSMLFFRGGKKLLVLATLARFERLLETSGFCRIHRAFLVNLDWVAAFDRQQVKGDDGQILPLGKSYVDVLPKQFFMITQKSGRGPAAGNSAPGEGSVFELTIPAGS